MDPKWLGPFKITHDIGEGFYTLGSCDAKSTATKQINRAHLKPLKQASMPAKVDELSHASSPTSSMPATPG